MNINDINKELLKIFLEKHGEVRLSKKHDFLAIERQRTDSHVIVGVSCNFFESCHTVISQFEIPIEDWDDNSKFIAMKDYVRQPIVHEDIDMFPWLHCIKFDMSVKAFEYVPISAQSHAIELELLNNPHYKWCNKEPEFDDFDDDFASLEDCMGYDDDNE